MIFSHSFSLISVGRARRVPTGCIDKQEQRIPDSPRDALTSQLPYFPVSRAPELPKAALFVIVFSTKQVVEQV